MTPSYPEWRCACIDEVPAARLFDLIVERLDNEPLMSAFHVEHGSALPRFFSCFLNNLSELRILTTFYFAKNDHQWVNFIFLKTITLSPAGNCDHPASGGRAPSESLRGPGSTRTTDPPYTDPASDPQPHCAARCITQSPRKAGG